MELTQIEVCNHYTELTTQLSKLFVTFSISLRN